VPSSVCDTSISLSSPFGFHSWQNRLFTCIPTLENDRLWDDKIVGKRLLPVIWLTRIQLITNCQNW
jgi:hypothetical protein